MKVSYSKQNRSIAVNTLHLRKEKFRQKESSQIVSLCPVSYQTEEQNIKSGEWNINLSQNESNFLIM